MSSQSSVVPTSSIGRAEQSDSSSLFHLTEDKKAIATSIASRLKKCSSISNVSP